MLAERSRSQTYINRDFQKKNHPRCDQLGKNPHQTATILPRTLKTNHMAANIITAEDLEEFKWDLLANIKEYLDKKDGKNENQQHEDKVWIKSHQVQRMLGISPGTLQTLRLNGTIPYSKVGGVLFYNKADIARILDDNMRNRIID